MPATLREQEYETDRDGGHAVFRTVPAPSLSAALRRYWAVMLLPVALLVAAGVFIGLHRTPTYTANAQLAVGSNNVNLQAVPGIVQANQQLAGTYSREISAEGVQQGIVKALGKSSAAGGSLSATPIPSSSIIQVSAQGSSASDAKKLANAGSDAFEAYITSTNSGSASSDQLLAQYQAAVTKYNRLNATPGHNKAALAAANLRRNALGSLYQNARSSETGGSPITVITHAKAASSDRSSVLQRLALIGLVLGLAVGIALAWVLARRRVRRLGLVT